MWNRALLLKIHIIFTLIWRHAVMRVWGQWRCRMLAHSTTICLPTDAHDAASWYPAVPLLTPLPPLPPSGWHRATDVSIRRGGRVRYAAGAAPWHRGPWVCPRRQHDLSRAPNPPSQLEGEKQDEFDWQGQGYRQGRVGQDLQERGRHWGRCAEQVSVPSAAFR